MPVDIDPRGKPSPSALPSLLAKDTHAPNRLHLLERTARRMETSACEQLLQVITQCLDLVIRLDPDGLEDERNLPTRFEHAAHFCDAGQLIGPELHGVGGESDIEPGIRKRQR